MRDAKLAILACCALWLMGACGGCGVSSASSTESRPSAADLARATVSGHWHLTVIVSSYSGPPPPATDIFQPGHRGVDAVVFASQCTGPGSCTLALWGSGGPDGSSFYAFYSSTTGLQGPPVSMPMVQSGTSYSQAIPIAGFGGARCPPSSTHHAPEQRITLTVTDATPAGSGWTATRLSGNEVFDAGWACSNGVFSGWTVGHLKITGTRG